MGAIWLRARSELRSRWGAALSLALLVGIAGGAVMAAAAGARRTDSAFPRFVASAKAPDVVIPMFPWLPIGQVPSERIATLPSVERGVIATVFTGSRGLPVASEPTEEGGSSTLPPPEQMELSVMTSDDPVFGRDVARLRILEGRAPNPARAEEVAVGFSAARDLGLKVGSTVALTFVPFGSEDAPPAGPPPQMRVRVVGISASPDDFPPRRTDSPLSLAVRGTPELRAALLGRAEAIPAMFVRLEGGNTALASFQRELGQLVPGAGTFILGQQDHTEQVQRSIRIHAVALWLVAAVLAGAALFVAGQTLGRQLLLESTEHPTLRAIGMSPRQLWVLGIVRALAIGGVSAAAAVLVAVLLSPATPVGVARTAEPSPGFAADWTVLGIGPGAIVVLLIGLAAWPAWRAARLARTGMAIAQMAPRQRPSAIGTALARAGIPPAAVAGVRMALEPGRGRSAVPVRSTLAAVVAGISALVTALTFAVSLANLLDTPRLYGWSIDANMADYEEPPSRLKPALDADPRIEAYAFSTGPVPLSVAGVRVDSMLMEATGVPMSLVEGRMPRGDGEIVLGSEVLLRTGRDVGDEVGVHLQGQPEPSVDLTIVGRAVFPPLGPSLSLGRGAVIPPSVGRTLFGPEAVEQGAADLSELSVRFVPGTDVEDAVDDMRRLHPQFRQADPIRPDDLANFARVDALPVLLAGALAALAAATLAHTLVTSIRRHRRDLAILKTLGFSRAQVRGAVGWQATTTAVAALLVAVPGGIAAGRWAWTLFADRLGVIPKPVVSVPALLAVVAGAVALVLLIAAAPARSAARMQPATILRTE